MHHDMVSGPDADTLAFMDRLKKHTETTASSLKDLFDKEGNTPAFQDKLDDVVYEIAFTDPEYAENASKLKNDRLSEEVAKEIAKVQRAKAAEIRRLVMEEAGLATEQAGNDIEVARANVAKQLEGVDINQLKADEVLRKLGILNETEEGAKFTYPRDLFPESVNNKWDIYLDSVANHMEIGRQVERGETSRSDLENADRMRRFAHNRITSDLDEIFGFKDLPDEEWDFKDTRKLVTKMLEAKFIDRPTSESMITSQALTRGFGKIGLGVIDKLSSKSN